MKKLMKSKPVNIFFFNTQNFLKVYNIMFIHTIKMLKYLSERKKSLSHKPI